MILKETQVLAQHHLVGNLRRLAMTIQSNTMVTYKKRMSTKKDKLPSSQLLQTSMAKYKSSNNRVTYRFQKIGCLLVIKAKFMPIPVLKTLDRWVAKSTSPVRTSQIFTMVSTGRGEHFVAQVPSRLQLQNLENKISSNISFFRIPALRLKFFTVPVVKMKGKESLRSESAGGSRKNTMRKIFMACWKLRSEIYLVILWT